jgi:lysophospholipase L1-like esterase
LGLCGAEPAAKVTRILIVGDSWATSITAENREGFPAPDVFDAALDANGLGMYETRGAVTAWGGRRAADWAKPAHLDEIRAELEAHPRIDFVHLIIGGNDFLSAVREPDFREKTGEERAAVWRRIVADTERIVDACLAARDNLTVVLADYDYLDYGAAEAFWQFDFHGVDTGTLNGWLVELGRCKRALAERRDRCVYVQNFGTLQHEFGVPPHRAPRPGQAPEFNPYPGGDPACGMPEGISPDGIHPNAEAHARLLQNAIDAVYAPALRAAADEDCAP